MINEKILRCYDVISIEKGDKILKDCGYDNGVDDFISLDKKDLDCFIIGKDKYLDDMDELGMFVVDKKGNILLECGLMGIINMENKILNLIKKFN